MAASSTESGIQQRLNLFDSTCLIVGIILGVAIYRFTPDIARAAASMPPWTLELVGGTVPMLVLFWVAGAIVSLCGALVYAELATSFPREGGDYVYLTKAFGRWAGFLFGWMLTMIVRPGDIAIMAMVFAIFARQLWEPAPIHLFDAFGQSYVLDMGRVHGVAAVSLLTGLNILGVEQGKWTQNILTLVKMVALAAIVLAAFLVPSAEKSVDPQDVGSFPVSVAFLFVMFAFGGWMETAYVAAEVKNARRNLLWAALIGLAAVTALYVAINLAFVHLLGFDGVARSEAVAADALNVLRPGLGGRAISALICLSALGAVNGMIFAGARISYAIGKDHAVFARLGRWNSRTGTPVRSLVLQWGISVLLVLVLGTDVDTIIMTSPLLYTFFLLTTSSLFVLRFKRPDTESPYRVTGFPVTPLIFAGVCAFLIYKTAMYAPALTACGFGLLLLGLPVYIIQAARREA